MDYHVLRLVYEIVMWLMLAYTGFYVDTEFTIQILCSEYKLNSGCYGGVAMCSGVVPYYISICIAGCRCMPNRNTLYRIKMAFAEFEACSLYLSVMHRMTGYLKDTSRVLKCPHVHYSFSSSQYVYGIRVKLTRDAKPRQVPRLSKHTANGDIMVSNVLVGEAVYVDNTALEDALHVQDIYFKFVYGYYFNEVHHNTNTDVIPQLYSKRKELQQANNPAQLVINAIMKRRYGKTIPKPIETETVVKTEQGYHT